jgi:hypothetical protein
MEKRQRSHPRIGREDGLRISRWAAAEKTSGRNLAMLRSGVMTRYPRIMLSALPDLGVATFSGLAATTGDSNKAIQASAAGLANAAPNALDVTSVAPQPPPPPAPPTVGLSSMKTFA